MPSKFDILRDKKATELTLSVEDESIDALNDNEHSAHVFDVLKTAGIVTVDTDTDASIQRIVLRSKSMAKYSDGPRAVIETFCDLYDKFGEPDDSMPVMRLSNDPIDTHRSRYGVQFQLRWPNCSAEEAAAFATKHMRTFSRQLYMHGEHSKNLTNELIYAQAHRKQGIILQTNPLGSCSVESEHRDYTDDRTVELWQHNIYNREQQLICLVGAVAFVNASNYLS